MAERVIRQLIDDMDGSEIPEGAGERIAFSVRGIDYQIDLTAGNAAAFDKALKPFLGAATQIQHDGQATQVANAQQRGPKTNSRGAVRRATTKGSRRAPRSSAATKTSPAQLATIREWARKNGFAVAERGRLSAEVVAAFAAAH